MLCQGKSLPQVRRYCCRKTCFSLGNLLLSGDTPAGKDRRGASVFFLIVPHLAAGGAAKLSRCMKPAAGVFTNTAQVLHDWDVEVTAP